MARYRRSYSGVSRKALSDYKWAIALISLLAIVTIFFAVVSKGFTNWDVKTWFPSTNVECEHVFEDGKCTLCEIECEHDFDEDGKCTICEVEETENNDVVEEGNKTENSENVENGEENLEE